ncbi:Predicted oxidoreductase [Acinetobacter marinus]|uniref:Predicted oxidoreductase n=1 Tax=Acinetobacter marinus TaxID=281375 RepID=A0A1G6LEL1_9GAMM|nr:aldo/keto reductase [Acinetobacter marinus]SDC41680.1 Predicted oxidoreductase [Acinetobacter marinus]
MIYRNLGNSGLKVPALSFGTATFAGSNDFFGKWGQTDVREAKRLLDMCFANGVNFFDTANVYSQGDAEAVLGEALKGRREQAIISSKATFKMGEGANDQGSSRFHLHNALDASLKRLQTDYIDLYLMHGFDASTPIEETLRTLESMVQSGKVRYIGCSNFAAWQLMKSLSISERLNLEKYVVYQGYYSLIGRDYEQELQPLLIDQQMGLMVWSPLGWGRLTGKIRRDQIMQQGRIQSGGDLGAPPINDELLFDVVDLLEKLAEIYQVSIAQVALNWVLQQPTVSNVIIGARNEKQLLDNLNVINWQLDEEHLQQLNDLTKQQPIYPHWVGAR